MRGWSASSSPRPRAPVGEVEPPIHEDKAPRPVSPYGASKLAGEGYCSAYARSFGLETVALRFGNVYGPYSDRKSSVVAAFIKRALAGEPLEIYGDGSQSRDFIHVDDLVRAIGKAASVPDIGGEVFHIATAQRDHDQRVGADADPGSGAPRREWGAAAQRAAARRRRPAQLRRHRESGRAARLARRGFLGGGIGRRGTVVWRRRRRRSDEDACLTRSRCRAGAARVPARNWSGARSAVSFGCCPGSASRRSCAWFCSSSWRG